MPAALAAAAAVPSPASTTARSSTTNALASTSRAPPPAPVAIPARRGAQRADDDAEEEQEQEQQPLTARPLDRRLSLSADAGAAAQAGAGAAAQARSGPSSSAAGARTSSAHGPASRRRRSSASAAQAPLSSSSQPQPPPPLFQLHPPPPTSAATTTTRSSSSSHSFHAASSSSAGAATAAAQTGATTRPSSRMSHHAHHHLFPASTTSTSSPPSQPGSPSSSIMDFDTEQGQGAQAGAMRRTGSGISLKSFPSPAASFASWGLWPDSDRDTSTTTNGSPLPLTRAPSLDRLSNSSNTHNGFFSSSSQQRVSTPRSSFTSSNNAAPDYLPPSPSTTAPPSMHHSPSQAQTYAAQRRDDVAVAPRCPPSPVISPPTPIKSGAFFNYATPPPPPPPTTRQRRISSASSPSSSNNRSAAAVAATMALVALQRALAVPHSLVAAFLAPVVTLQPFHLAYFDSSAAAAALAAADHRHAHGHFHKQSLSDLKAYSSFGNGGGGGGGMMTMMDPNGGASPLSAPSSPSLSSTAQGQGVPNGTAGAAGGGKRRYSTLRKLLTAVYVAFSLAVFTVATFDRALSSSPTTRTTTTTRGKAQGDAIVTFDDDHDDMGRVPVNAHAAAGARVAHERPHGEGQGAAGPWDALTGKMARGVRWAGDHLDSYGAYPFRPHARQTAAAVAEDGAQAGLEPRQQERDWTMVRRQLSSSSSQQQQKVLDREGTKRDSPLSPFGHTYRFAKMHDKVNWETADEIDHFAFSALREPREDEVTACMYTNEAWLEFLPDFVDAWNGPVSLVFEVAHSRRATAERRDVLRSIAAVRDAHPLVAQHVDVHIVGTPPHASERTLNKTRERLVRDPQALNMHANLARLFAHTDLVWLVADARIVPSPNLRDRLAGADVRELAANRGDLVVVPSFAFVRDGSSNVEAGGPPTTTDSRRALGLPLGDPWNGVGADEFGEIARHFTSSLVESLPLPMDSWPESKQQLVDQVQPLRREKQRLKRQVGAPGATDDPMLSPVSPPVIAMYDRSWDANAGPSNWFLWRREVADRRLLDAPSAGGGAGLGPGDSVGGGASVYRIEDYDLQYAPLVVFASRAQPWCTERFDRMRQACTYQMYLAGARMWVVPDAWAYTLEPIAQSKAAKEAAAAAEASASAAAAAQSPSANADPAATSQLTDLDIDPADKLSDAITARLYSKFHQEACMHYGREFLSVKMWDSDKAQHVRYTCARVLANWGMGN